MIVIASSHTDFSSVLAGQLHEQLGLASAVMLPGEVIHAQAQLVVATEPVAAACSVISVTPPCRLSELLAEIEAALRKPEEEIALGDYRLRLRQKLLLHTPSGRKAALTDKEAQLLHCLSNAGDAGISREQLLKAVWGIEAALDTHTLDTHIYRLRGKLRELADDDATIVAIEGGYRVQTESHAHERP